MIDILYSQNTLREGNFESKFNAGKSNAESNEKFTKEGGSIEIGKMDKEDGDDLTSDFDKKNEINQEKKEASKISM